MSDSVRWIVVNRWDEFQHPDALRTGNIPWLKTFTRLLSDSSYLGLNAGERAVLHGIWLEYARARGQLTVDTASLTRRLSLRVTKHHLEALNRAGFIDFSASRPASTTASGMQAQTRREEKDLRAPARKAKRSALPPVCPICTADRGTDRKLVDHLDALHDQRPDAIEQTLTDMGWPEERIQTAIREARI